MTFQSAVQPQMGLGVVGELFTDGPHRTQSFIVDSADAAYNVFGRAFTKTSESKAEAGSGGLEFAGIMVNPKGNSLNGTVAGGTLAPSLTLPNETQAEFCTMGSIVVSLPDVAEIGDLVVYDDTTGALETISPGDVLPAGKTFANATVDYFSVTAAGLAVITVSPALVIPQPAP